MEAHSASARDEAGEAHSRADNSTSDPRGNVAVSRATRDFPIFPSVECPRHGPQIGRTRCKWCSFDPFKVNRSALPSLGPDVLGRTDSPVPPRLSFDLIHDQFGVAGDLVE